MPQTRQLAAIMFTDIVGYTSMMAKNETQALASLKEVRELLQPLIKQFNGKWVKEIGDGTLSSFNSALDAVNCALSFQKALQRVDFKVRIGIHVGDTTFTEKDVFGDGVNIASRIEPLAPPGGIYISGRVNEDIQNHPEIRTEFVGDRKLKNISRPIKIYTLVGEGLPDPAESPTNDQVGSFFSDLWQRRFPQTLFIYLAVSVLLVLLTKWFLNKYLLSPHWGELSWILLLSLLPSVAVIAYYHGRSGREKWMKAEKVTIPLNLLFTASLLFYSFQGKELGSTTQNITVQDEEGKQIQVVQAKGEFRKSVAFFFFENQSDIGADDWLKAGIPVAMEYDLEQDPFVQIKGAYEMVQDIKKSQPTELAGLSNALMRKITQDHLFDYFIFGSYKVENGNYTINTSLYSSDPMRPLSSQSVTGGDFFGLIDQLTIKLKEDLEIPSGRIESTEDLPLSSILTASVPTYHDIIQGHNDHFIDNNYPSAIERFESAVKKDDQCT
ncbi:MAG: adenylate/guanylate cyclase domain-containing protein, partial [Cyclobacteriaceae bacterium]